MDIEGFYDADERRRRSAELELGRDWTDQEGVRYELSWVEDTGELYVMREPVPVETVDPFGGIHVVGSHGVNEAEVQGMSVAVVGSVAARDELEGAVAGWEEAMARPDSVAWLVARLREHGILTGGDPGSPLTT
ncbi:MAG: hypothetical protein ACRDZR_09845 [Acidimicrobiales bacterium]